MPSSKALMSRPVVICCGVAVVDFVFAVDSMPREPIKYRARDAAIVGGGCAANAAVAVERLGGQAVLAARLGDDMIGDMVVRDLEAEGVDCSMAQRYPGQRSSFSSIYVSPDGERQIVGFRDKTMPEHPEWIARMAPPRFDAVLADTRWGHGAAAAMQLARDAGVPGVIDGEAPISEAAGALPLASHIVFSRQGIADLTGERDPEAALRGARRHTPAFLAVTDGSKGLYWLEGTEVRHMTGFAVNVVDTLGAGDVWHGAFALALARGEPEVPAMRFASAVAALKCTRFGGRRGTPALAEVQTFLKEHP